MFYRHETSEVIYITGTHLIKNWVTEFKNTCYKQKYLEGNGRKLKKIFIAKVLDLYSSLFFFLPHIILLSWQEKWSSFTVILCILLLCSWVSSWQRTASYLLELFLGAEHIPKVCRAVAEPGPGVSGSLDAFLMPVGRDPAVTVQITLARSSRAAASAERMLQAARNMLEKGKCWNGFLCVHPCAPYWGRKNGSTLLGV